MSTDEPIYIPSFQLLPTVDSNEQAAEGFSLNNYKKMCEALREDGWLSPADVGERDVWTRPQDDGRITAGRVDSGRYIERLPTNRKRKRERAKQRRRERLSARRRAADEKRAATVKSALTSAAETGRLLSVLGGQR